MINQHHFGRKPVVSSIYFFEQIRGLHSSNAQRDIKKTYKTKRPVNELLTFASPKGQFREFPY